MVFPVDCEAPKAKASTAAVPERAHPLRDSFFFPTWGSRRLLRCSKINPSGDSSVPQQSPDPQSDSSHRFRPLEQPLPTSTLPPPCKLQKQPFVEKKEGGLKFRICFIKSSQEKEETSKRLPIIHQRTEFHSLPEPEAVLLGKKQPQNLKEAKAASDAPIMIGNSSEEAVAAVLPPLQEENRRKSKRNKCKPKRLQPLVEAACSGEKDNEVKSKKLSLQLSKEEIEADFLEITGSKLPHRSKNKRPRKLQKQLDMIFPCLDWTLDAYKIHDLSASEKDLKFVVSTEVDLRS